MLLALSSESELFFKAFRGCCQWHSDINISYFNVV